MLRATGVGVAEKDGLRILFSGMCEKPAWTLRHGQDYAEEEQRRYGSDGKHKPPRFLCCQPIAHKVSKRDANRQRKLIESDQHAPRLRWRQFRNVNRGSNRRETDTDPKNGARHDKRCHIRRKRRKHRAHDENRACPNQRSPSAYSVGNGPSDHRSYHGADKHNADDQFFHLRREGEAVPDKYDGGSDDAHVIAIQNAAKRSDERDPSEKSVVYKWLLRGQRIRHGRTRAS